MPRPQKKSAGDQMLDEIRAAISRHVRSMSERECYELLDAEAEGWRMRLQELDEEEEADAGDPNE